MEFKALETTEQLEKIEGAKGFTIIFKHNTTCPISKGVKRRFEEGADMLPEVSSIYVLDLLAHRDISDAIAEKFNVEHQSPQLLLIKNGKCAYNEALYEISTEATAKAISNN